MESNWSRLQVWKEEEISRLTPKEQLVSRGYHLNGTFTKLRPSGDKFLEKSSTPTENRKNPFKIEMSSDQNFGLPTNDSGQIYCQLKRRESIVFDPFGGQQIWVAAVFTF